MNKLKTASQIVAQLQDGMTIGIGGWGPRRKPMALIREILRSDLKDLTIVSYGGADVGMLCAAGKVKKVIFAFVSLDFIPLEPFFRKAREQGQLEVMEIDEGMLLLGLRAAAWGCPSRRSKSTTCSRCALKWTSAASSSPCTRRRRRTRRARS